MTLSERSVSAGPRAGGGDAFDGSLLELVVGVQVRLGGLGALVTQPQRDRVDVDVLGSQQHHAVGMAKHVRRNAFARQRWASGRRDGGVFVNQPRDSREEVTGLASRRKQRIVRLASAFAAPYAQYRDGFGGEHRATFLRPLPVTRA